MSWLNERQVAHMALPRQLTVADLWAMPESERGERYELIEGELFVTPTPTWRHQAVSSNLSRVLSTYVHTLRLGWVVDNVSVHVDDRTYLVPDLVFVSRERQGVISAAGLEAAPDLVCEILSPSTRRRDLITKRALYTRIGVREYWLIDPGAQTVTVLALEAGRFVELPQGDGGGIRSRLWPSLQLPLTTLFEDADIAPED